MELRQLLAACARSASVISTRTSFSASANVAGETSGPTGGAVPKADGVPGGGFSAWPPGVGVADCAATGFGSCACNATAAPNSPAEASDKNSLRDFAMLPPLLICLLVAYGWPQR